MITIELFWALVGSKWVRRLGLCVIALGAYAFWEQRTEQKGAEKVTAKIEEKANADAQTATDVRETVAKSKAGRTDPYRRP